MSIDYSAITGYGFEMTDQHKYLLSKFFELNEDMDVEEFADEINTLTRENTIPFRIESSGSCYSGNLYYYVLVKSNDATKLVEKIRETACFLQRPDIGFTENPEDYELISEVLVW